MELPSVVVVAKEVFDCDDDFDDVISLEL